MNFQSAKSLLMRCLWAPTVSFLAMAPQNVYSKIPGMDGGGGVSVVTSTGQLRFWDMAQVENIAASTITSKTYNSIMLDGKRYVTRQAEAIDPMSFFECGIEKLKNSQNIYLETLAHLPVNLKVAFTEIPFPTEIDPDWLINFKSQTDWVYSLTITNPQKLYTNSLEKNQQLLTAAYAVQSTNGLDSKMKIPTLIVQNQLYKLLPKSDQCALQVHELLRWMAHDTEYEQTWLLSREWVHAEIETLTAKIMLNQIVGQSEIPAAPVLKLITLMHQKGMKLENDIDRDYQIPYDISTENYGVEGRANAATSLILRRMARRANETVYLAESGIAGISRVDSTRLARIFMRKNKSQGDRRRVDLCEILPFASETTQQCSVKIGD